MNLASSFPGNNGKPSPFITTAVAGNGSASVSGTSPANDIIEVFKSDAGGINANQYLGTATADGSENWTLSNITLSSNDAVVATATDGGNNTSEFSAAFTITSSNCAVTNTNDSGPGSLRDAITQANNTPGLDNICFDIPGIAPHTISLNTALPDITETITIDGTTQPENGYSGDSPKIIVYGNAMEFNGFTFQPGAENSEIKGLFIRNFQSGCCNTNGIYINASNVKVSNNVIGNNYYGYAISVYAPGCIIQGNKLGTDASGQTSLGNFRGGVYINGANGGLIGGLGANEGNLISGNASGVGVHLENSSYNEVKGNKIGVDITGTNALGNSTGIVLSIGKHNIVENNLISGHFGFAFGVQIGNSDSNLVIGNKVGTDISGSVAIGNTYGISMSDSKYNVIGGLAPGESNLVSGNGRGIIVDYFSSYNRVINNFIGTNSDGTIKINNGAGVLIQRNSFFNTIGGSNLGEGNLISGNDLGINIGTSATRNNILGNVIGPDKNFSGSLNPFAYGIAIESGCNSNTIGGAGFFERNIISGNGTGIGNGADSCVVIGNKIGTDSSGTIAIGNGEGINLSGSANRIGGVISGEGNLISGNGVGVRINNSNSNLVKGNKIGTDKTGTQDIGNTSIGIISQNSINTVIGGSSIGEGNLISGNNGSGISLASARNTKIIGNLIGTDITGNNALTGNYGIDLGGNSDSTVIGGGNPGEGNVIVAGAGGNGAIYSDAGYFEIKGNKIGTNSSGTAALGAAQSGIYISQFSPGYIKIGGANLGEGNLISGCNRGIQIYTSFIEIKGNKIGSNLAGTAAIANADIGINLDGSGGGHDNIVGGAGPGEGNLISGNAYGIIISSPSNIIKGNKIGTDITGTQAISNSQFGIGVQYSNGHDNIIGGSIAGEGNLISGNNSYGIIIEATTRNNQIKGNKIGTDISGNNPLPNLGNGIYINNSNHNFIGGSTTAEGNIIANNQKGVSIENTNGTSADSNLISRNLIYNQVKGIELHYNSSQQGNNGKTKPVVTASSSGNGNAAVSGTSQPNDIIEVFKSDTGGVNANEFLGSTTANGSGDWTINNLSLAVNDKVIATSTDANNNTSEFSDTLNTSSGELVVSVSGNATICIGNYTQLSAFANGATSYSWQPTSGLDNPNIYNPIASPASTTTYTVIASNASKADTGQVTVFVLPLLLADAGKDTSICVGGMAALGGNPSAKACNGGTITYQWNPATGLNSAILANPTASPLITTTYTLTAYNGANTATDVVTVTVNNITYVNAGSDETLCKGASTILGANPAAISCTGATQLSFSWSPEEGLNSVVAANPVATPDTTTTYILTVYDGNGGIAKDSVKITVNTPEQIVASSGNSPICQGQSTSLNATGSGSFSWIPTTGLNDPNSSAPVATPSSSTNYIVTLTDGNGCTSQAGVFINVLPAPNVTTSGNATVCKGNSTLIQAFANSNNFQWSPTTGLNTPNGSSSSASPTATTTYQVTASNSNCTSQSSLTVLVLDKPIATYTYNSPGLNMQFTPQQALSSNTYTWTFGDNGTSNIANPSHTYSAAGTYQVCSTLENSCGKNKYCTDVIVVVPDVACCH